MRYRRAEDEQHGLRRLVGADEDEADVEERWPVVEHERFLPVGEDAVHVLYGVLAVVRTRDGEALALAVLLVEFERRHPRPPATLRANTSACSTALTSLATHSASVEGNLR